MLCGYNHGLRIALERVVGVVGRHARRPVADVDRPDERIFHELCW
jgi:hypothetical protein